ncbi:MAG: hypothetical protein ACFB6R_05100 [Alphaproteobacteria bacterium]
MPAPRPSPPRASIRDLPRPRLVPRGRQALVTELMQLEHMRERVENELQTWADKERHARARLSQIDARLETIYDAIADLHARSRRLTVVEGGALKPPAPPQPRPPEAGPTPSRRAARVAGS